MADSEPPEPQKPSVPEDGVLLPLVWVFPDDMPVVASNQAIGQVVGENEMLLILGYVAPPAILGDPEERKRQAEQISFVPVNAVGRFAMNRRRLEELRDALDQTLKNHDATYGDEGQA